MREYGQVQSAFWQSPDAQAFTDTGKLLAVYLLTGPHTNGIGCFRLPDGYVMADLGWSQERVSEGFTELFGKGFANRFDGVVFIPNFLRWNRIVNGNIATARFGEFDQLPKGDAKMAAARAMLEFCQHWSDWQRKALETVSGTVTQTVCQPEPNPTQREPNPERNAPRRQADAAPAFSFSFPLNDGAEFGITSEQAAEFAELYPAIDVAEQLRKVRAWCIANPSHRKTRRGALRFVNSWLSREQDKGPRNSAGSPRPDQQTSPAASRRLA